MFVRGVGVSGVCGGVVVLWRHVYRVVCVEWIVGMANTQNEGVLFGRRFCSCAIHHFEYVVS